MPLYEVCLKGDDIYSLRVLASSDVEAIKKAMAIVTNLSEEKLPNYRVQINKIESDQPICRTFDEFAIDP